MVERRRVKDVPTNAPIPLAPAKSKKKDDIAPSIPWLDNLLSLAFLALQLQLLKTVLGRQNGQYWMLEYCAWLVVVYVATIVIKIVFRGIAKCVGRKKGKRNVRKFADQAWQLAIHVSMTVYELYIFYYADGKECWDDTTKCYTGPGGAPGVPATDALERFYVVQAAIWGFTAFSHRWMEERHKDYFIMYAHHVITMFLIILSWALPNLRFGHLVLLIHDASDIGIDLLKMFNYLGLGSESGLYLTEVVFVSGLAVWIWLRLWIYPTKALPSGLYESGPVCEHTWDNCGFLRMSLVTLQIMHAYWTFLLCRILVVGIFAGKGHEVGAETYEGDSDDDDE